MRHRVIEAGPSDQIRALAVRPEQKRFVAPSVLTIAQDPYLQRCATMRGLGNAIGARRSR